MESLLEVVPSPTPQRQLKLQSPPTDDLWVPKEQDPRNGAVCRAYCDINSRPIEPHGSVRVGLTHLEVSRLV